MLIVGRWSLGCAAPKPPSDSVAKEGVTMPRLRHALWIAALMLPAAAVADGREPYISWGKAGVPFERYREDSITCGAKGATRDMREQTAFKDVIHGKNFQDSALDRGDAVEYVMIYQRNFRGNVPKLQRFLVNGVEECLMGKDYAPFALTRGQAEQLSKYEKGSQDRFHYLHQLSSDPKILQAQALGIARK
jgi:hypothetical protein